VVTEANKGLPAFKGQCELLQSLEFKKHMAETRGEYHSPLTASVLHSVFHILKTHIPELIGRYALQYEIQAAALLLWKRYRDVGHHSLYPEISICESILSHQENPPMRPWQHIGSEKWEAALDKTFEKFEGMSPEEIFTLAREQQEKGEPFIPSAFVEAFIDDRSDEHGAG